MFTLSPFLGERMFDVCRDMSRLNSSFFSKSSCFVAENAQLKRAQSQCSISSCKFDSCISRSISISFWILRLMFIFQAKIIGHYAPHLVRLSHGQMSKPPVPPWGHQWDSLRRRHLCLDRTRFAHRSAALYWWSSSWKAAHCEWRMLHSIHLPINECYDCVWMLNDAYI